MKGHWEQKKCRTRQVNAMVRYDEEVLWVETGLNCYWYKKRWELKKEEKDVAVNICYEKANKGEQNLKVDGEGWGSTTGGDFRILLPRR